MIQMAAAMDKLTGENAKLNRENVDLRAQLRTRPSVSTEELSYKLDILISHAEKTSSLMEKTSSGVEQLQKDSDHLVNSLYQAVNAKTVK